MSSDIPVITVIPNIFLKRLELKNFGKYSHVVIDFFDETNRSKEMMTCLIGPNGCGKTTILSAIQTLFSKYSHYDKERFMALFTKYLRIYARSSGEENKSLDLLIKGTFVKDGSSEYEVAISRNDGVLSFHPEDVSDYLPYFCFSARFDQELDRFQLVRSKWNQFKELFEGVTGYEISEKESPFSQSSDARMNKVMQDYVLEFEIQKEHEKISHRQCSAGEKKVIKTFSTILNKEIDPQIILIDNAVMHIEGERHVSVLRSIEKCFAGKQIILTCHSEPIKRSFSNDSKVIDLRQLSSESVDSFGKMKIIDELKELSDKIYSCKDSVQKQHTIELINRLIVFSKDYKTTITKEVIEDFRQAIYQAYDLFTQNVLIVKKQRINSVL